MPINFWTILPLLLLAASCGLPDVECAVDESRPDISVYRLKPVANKADGQANLPVRDYASGAIKMRKSLFSNDFQVRCSAYAHLFKLIRRVELDTSSANKMDIKLDTVTALATVADADREQYGELFKLYQPQVAAETFKEAIEQLERRHVQTPVSKDAWLELTDCAHQFELQLADFLAKPRRAEQIARYRDFKSASPAGKQAAVADSKEPKAQVFSDQELEAARERVERFDDEELRQLRASLHEQRRQVVVVVPSEGPNEDAPAANGKLEIELDVPIEQQAARKPTTDAHDERQVLNAITLMDFLKRWVQLLESVPKSRVRKQGKLTVDSAIDYRNNWDELSQLKLDPSSELGERVAAYLAEPENQRIHRIMGQIYENFVQATGAIARMKNRKRPYKSMEELDREYNHVIKMLDEVSEMVDFHDVTRAVMNSKLREHQEFKTMNSFIESDSW